MARYTEYAGDDDQDYNGPEDDAPEDTEDDAPEADDTDDDDTDADDDDTDDDTESASYYGRFEMARLYGMVDAEMEMAKAWANMNSKERQAYLRAHPTSKFRNGGNGRGANKPATVDFSTHLTNHGFKSVGRGVFKHKSGHTVTIKRNPEFKHHIVVAHPNGDVSHRKTNSTRRAMRILTTLGQNASKMKGRESINERGKSSGPRARKAAPPKTGVRHALRKLAEVTTKTGVRHALRRLVEVTPRRKAVPVRSNPTPKKAPAVKAKAPAAKKRVSEEDTW